MKAKGMPIRVVKCSPSLLGADGFDRHQRAHVGTQANALGWSAAGLIVAGPLSASQRGSSPTKDQAGRRIHRVCFRLLGLGDRTGHEASSSS